MARKEKTPEAPAKTKTELFFEKLKAIRERHRNGDCGVQTVRNYGMMKYKENLLKLAEVDFEREPSEEHRNSMLVAASNFKKSVTTYKNSDKDYAEFKRKLKLANKAGTRRPQQH